MDATLLNKIDLLSQENIQELRLFINFLLTKQGKQTVSDSTIEPNAQFPNSTENITFINPLLEMEQIPVQTDIIIDRYSIYEDSFNH